MGALRTPPHGPAQVAQSRLEQWAPVMASSPAVAWQHEQHSPEAMPLTCAGSRFRLWTWAKGSSPRGIL